MFLICMDVIVIMWNLYVRIECWNLCVQNGNTACRLSSPYLGITIAFSFHFWDKLSHFDRKVAPPNNAILVTAVC